MAVLTRDAKDGIFVRELNACKAGWQVLDWEKQTLDRLEAEGLGGAIEPEVAAELAHHLESVCESWMSRGLSEEESVRRTWSEVVNWPRLARKIRFAREGEELMKNRIKTLWFPGLAMTVVAMGLLRAAMRAGFQPQIVWLTPGISILFYVPWLAILPVVGALATYWSRSQGGSVGVRLTAALFTVVTMATIFILLMPVVVLVDRHVPWSTFMISWTASMVGWVLVPGAALIVGALPFLKGVPREASQTASQIS